MLKTLNNKTFKLVRYSTFSTILIVEQNGESLKNEFGGFPVLHTGSHKYIENCWKKLSTI